MNLNELCLIEVGPSPEDVIITDKGSFITALGDGRIVEVSAESEPRLVANTKGRPLGLEYFDDSKLVVCDSEHGLLLVDMETKEIEVLVGKGEHDLFLCNNAAIAKDGSIYFSDSSQRNVVEKNVTEMAEAIPTGRLLVRKPNGEVQVLLHNLFFSNGVAVSPDNSFLLLAETGRRRILKVHLSSERYGQAEIFAENLPGLPDNISVGSDSLFWVAFPMRDEFILKLVHALPNWCRSPIAQVSELLKMKPQPYFHVTAFDQDGAIVHDFINSPKTYKSVTGVRERNGIVAFSSYYSNGICFSKMK